MHDRTHGPERIDYSDAATRQLLFDRNDICPSDGSTATRSKPSQAAGGGLPRRSPSCAIRHARRRELTTCKEFHEHFNDPAVQLAGALKMNRTKRLELERKLGQAYRLALEPTDPLTQERLAQLIEELEFQLQDQRKVA
jgi:hypothetical protein